MRTLGRVLLMILAGGFGYAVYVYLTIPDVRALRTTNPASTAFMELRAREARAGGEQPRKVQRWISYNRISSHLKRAVLVTEDSAFWQVLRLWTRAHRRYGARHRAPMPPRSHRAEGSRT